MPEGGKKSRQQLIDAPDVPEIIGADQFTLLLIWMNEIGYARPGFNGAEALTYTEIAAWQSLTQTELSRQDAKLMRQLSEHYVDQLSQSHAKDTPAPYCSDPLNVSDEQAQADKVVSFFRRLPTVKK